MAEQVELAAEKRTDTGKGPAGRLRGSGRIPAVMYGAAVEGTTSLHVDARDLYHVLHTPAGMNVIVRLQVDGDEVLAMPRELQRHPVRGDLFHVDFVTIDRDTLVHVEVPVRLNGTEKVAAPGVVTHILHSIPLLVRPLDIPDHFELDVADMEIGDTLRVEDIDLPEGSEFDIEADRTVVTITAPTIVEEEDDEAEVPEGLAAIMAGLEEGEELTEEELQERLEAARAEAAEAGEDFPADVVPEDIQDPSDVEATGEGPTTDE
ncbi:MAG: 50S ribosomal protein L25 [Actinobacteria bacterium]|nr:50S ribosomal protein L25 [Actinomycetota bacterium]